ncbi:MAG: reverse transcriptase domain-containing protein [Candidatus Uhrbacteria bacterium]
MKVYKNVFNAITKPESLFLAWQRFRKGKSKRKDVARFEWSLEQNIFELHQDLVSETYRHGSYSDFFIADPKLRHIHKSMVCDRVVHHAVYQVLYPMFDQSFIFDSYSCRLGKGTHASVNRLKVFVRKVSRNYTAPCFALKFDIKKFFDSVDHETLLDILNQKIFCTKTNCLLVEIVESFSKFQTVGGGVVT